MLLEAVATDVLSCWRELAHRVEAPQQGRSPIAVGQVLRSTGDAGGALAVAAVFQFSGLMDAAGSAAIRPSGGFCRNMAGLQTSQITASMASGAWRGFPVRRPLNY